jgi:hypothetical protein
MLAALIATAGSVQCLPEHPRCAIRHRRTGFVQAPPSGGPDDGLEGVFNNPTYGDTFGVFSPNRDFTPVGSTTTQGLFFIPGTMGGTPAEVSGFGAVFSDVDLADSTEIEFFDKNGNVLTSRFVQPGSVADASLSFLGVTFNAGEEIASIRIITGTDPLEHFPLTLHRNLRRRGNLRILAE